MFDIGLVLLIGVFLMRPESSFFQALWRSTAAHPFGSIATTAVLALVAYLSLFGATVPGEALDRVSRAWISGGETAGNRRAQQVGFVLPFLSQRADGTLFGIFRRNIVVTDSDLIEENKAEGGDRRLKLRGRDLRYAKLDRTDMRGADLTGAALDGASLVGVNLEDAWLNCAEMDRLLLNDDRAAAKCASAQHIDLSRAQLANAHLSGIDLRDAKLDEAQLEGADLSNAALVGASFSSAHLEKADLTGGVDAQGANFLNAALQGADLTG
ncbi:MAG: pentapeptide repeat-containing protein, partial [Hyphomicrobium sp.]